MNKSAYDYQELINRETNKTPKQRAMRLLETAICNLREGYWAEDVFIKEALSEKQIEETHTQIYKLVERVYKNELKTKKEL